MKGVFIGMNGMNGMNGMVTMVGLQGVHWPQGAHDVAWAVWAHSLVIGLLGASIPLLLGGITLLPMVGYELLQRQWRRQRQRRRQIRCGAGVRSAPIVSSRTKKIIPVLVAAAREAESEAAADWSEVRYRWLEASSLQPMEMATLPRMPRYALN